MPIYALPLSFLLALLCGGFFPAQSPRDDWKPGRTHEVSGDLIYSLAGAPLTAKERGQINRLIDNPTVRDSFTDTQRVEERQTVMSARVGFIKLAEDGSKQVLVQGPSLFCGANGNCSYWLFTRRHDRLRLVLDAAGAFLVRYSSSHGFHDVATSWHMSAYEDTLTVYRYNGANYEKVDCYTVKRDRDSPDQPPVITACGD